MRENRNTFLETADKIGRELCRDALWSKGRCNWLGWSMEPQQNQWVPAHKTYGPEVYAGTCGIGLFLARLHAFTGDKVVLETARAAARHAATEVTGLDDFTRIGLYSGQTGIGYQLLTLGELLGDNETVDRGLELLLDLQSLEPDEKALDVIGGSAGAIPAFIDAGRRYTKPALLDLARKHGEHLLGTVIKSDEGWAWDTMHLPNQKPLTGYSHGVAGVVCALLECHQLDGDERFREAAREGLRYERSHFSQEHRNWPDFRQMDPTQTAPSPPSYTMGWCHGAPGIGMGRIRTQQLLPDDPKVAGEIEVAIQSTIPGLAQPVAQGSGNYSLCHGTCGNADLMLLAADELGREDLRRHAELVGDNGIRNVAQLDLPWICGLVQTGVTPSLLLGLAGIGYFYLRLYDSKSVPSVLLVKP